MAVKTLRIYQLPAVTTPGSELPGAVFEVEVLTGPVPGAYTNKKLTAEQLVAFLDTNPATSLHYRTLSVAQAQDEATDSSLPGFRPGWFYRINGRASTDGDVVMFAISTRGLDEQNAWLVEQVPQQGGGYTETCTPVSYDLATDTTSARNTGITQGQLDAVATTLPLRPTRTADDTLTAADIGAVACASSASPITLTVAAGLGLPAPTGANVGAARVCYPLQTGAGLLTLAAAAGVTLLPAPGGGLNSPGQGGRLVLIWLDTDTVLVEGGVQ